MCKIGIVHAVAACALFGLTGCGGGDQQADAPSAPAGPTIQVAGLAGDPVAGQRAFSQCRTCHSIEAGVNRVGPSLHGIIGRHSGMVEGYSYSAANKASGRVWDNETLFAFLENPRKDLPGTKMSFAGISDPQQRADLIAYLNSHD